MEKETKVKDEKKKKLIGEIKFFTGERNNMPIQIVNGEKKDMAGGIYFTDEILEEFKSIIGDECATVKEI